jgi:hypothetical protein
MDKTSAAAAIVVAAALIYIGYSMMGPEPDTQPPGTTLPAATQTTIAYEEMVEARDAGKEADGGCEAIEDQRMRGMCMRDAAVAAGDPQLCADIEGDSDRDECYYRVALKTKNKAVCAKIGADFKREACERNAEGFSGGIRPP